MARPLQALACPRHADLCLVDECRRGILLEALEAEAQAFGFDSLDECIAAIEGYIEHHNANDARPLRWSEKREYFVKAWRKGDRKPQESAS